MIKYIPDPVIQDISSNFTVHGRVTPGILGSTGWPFHQNVGGRITHDDGSEEDANEPGVHRDVTLVRRAIEAMGIDYQVVFPTPMLGLGMHPETDVEVALAHGYNRWFCENVMPGDKRIRSLLYLPFNDPQACEKFVAEFGEKEGVIGFVVTSVRYKPVHHNSYMRLYACCRSAGCRSLSTPGRTGARRKASCVRPTASCRCTRYRSRSATWCTSPTG